MFIYVNNLVVVLIIPGLIRGNDINMIKNNHKVHNMRDINSII
jgi:hypothetical protein